MGTHQRLVRSGTNKVIVCLLAGHAYMIVLVLGCQTLVYREVTALFALGAPKSDKDENKGKDPWSKTLNWYFFAVTNYFLYGESIIYYFKVCPASFYIFTLMLSLLPLPACRIRRCANAPLRDESPLHQLYVIHDWLRGLCRFPPEAVFEVPVRTVLLGSYVIACHCVI